MKFVELRVEGFGKLAGRTTAFDPHFNVVYGPNEAGKSTLTAALLATLYGFGRGDKELWRPWSGTRFATALTYLLADGRFFEVRRDFDRDGKGVHVYDASGNDASGECSVGRVVNPGHAHLGIPLEVFVNASFVGQGGVAIDGARAERISHALARALDGGPREDAALGAMKRLDDALANYVGKKRATVNAPLRHLHDEIAEAEERANEMRARLRAQGELRARLEAETQRSNELDATLREHERRGRGLRAYTLRSRLDALREIRDDLAALQAGRAEYDDVEGFPSYLVDALEDFHHEWIRLDALARTVADESARHRFTPAQAAELEERSSDGGAIGDEAFAELEASGNAATEARNLATVASDRAQAARRSIGGGSGGDGRGAGRGRSGHPLRRSTVDARRRRRCACAVALRACGDAHQPAQRSVSHRFTHAESGRRCDGAGTRGGDPRCRRPRAAPRDLDRRAGPAPRALRRIARTQSRGEAARRPLARDAR